METRTAAPPEVLDEAEWTPRRDAHERRVDAWVGSHLQRRRSGVPHPVEDFLFTYYSQRPAALRRWHPGYGVRLAGPSAQEYDGLKGYAVSAQPDGLVTAEVTREHVCAQQPLLEGLHRLLTATAGMDLYKHSFRLTPMVPSELVADCFELAREIRVLDMRASPYDLSDLGYSPVLVETPEGKQEYAAAQCAFAERGAPLRERLIAECERLLAS